jgi:hypothetical protein
MTTPDASVVIWSSRCVECRTGWCEGGVSLDDFWHHQEERVPLTGCWSGPSGVLDGLQ